MASAAAAVGSIDEGGDVYSGKTTVAFPRRNQGLAQQSLKLEVDQELSAENTNPRNMWQVYALGGFMVMRWVWARWRERNDGDQLDGPSPSD